MKNISLQLTDFKCHKDTSITLNNLTLLTGANAAGKSSVIQSILLAKLALSNKKEGASVVDISLKDQLYNLDLGNVDDLINKNTLDDKVEIFINEKKFYFGGDEAPEINTLRMHIPEDYEDIAHIFDNIQYLSAEREGPRYEYDLDNKRKQGCGCNGQYTASVIFNNDFTQIRPAKVFAKEGSAGFKAQLNEWIQYLFPNISLTVVANGLTKIQASVNNGNAHTVSVAPNIGFGISYGLPILVELLLATEESFVIIENPEAHLHAKAQSNMGYFIGKMAASGVRVLVETHSEHIVNGIRRAIVSKDCGLKADDVTIYFFAFLSEVLNRKKITVDSLGNLSAFPVDFFDQQRQDSMEIFKLQG